MKSSPSSSFLLACAASLAMLAASCGSADIGPAEPEALISIIDPWSRQPAESQVNTAVYGVVSNQTEDDVRIVSASSPAAEVVELHETLMDDSGAMSMREVPDGFVVRSGDTFTLEPGGPHVMMLGVDPAAYPNPVEVTLRFDDGASITFEAEVRMIDGGTEEMDDSVPSS
jgi:copper(I)-binding protein